MWESFDADDVQLTTELLASCRHGVVLVGVNCRDLQALSVSPTRFAELAPQLPRGYAHVAESGVACVADVTQLVARGYRLALVGTALMSVPEPQRMLAELLAAGRAPTTTSASRPELEMI
jgi:indole-3-glycerol phosphate synthase